MNNKALIDAAREAVESFESINANVKDEFLRTICEQSVKALNSAIAQQEAAPLAPTAEWCNLCGHYAQKNYDKAAAPVAPTAEPVDTGKLWSLFRDAMTMGIAIQQDTEKTGRGYELHSAHIDSRASEYADKATALFTAPAEPVSDEPVAEQEPEDKPFAFARRWYVAGEVPKKEINERGRLAWPSRFKMEAVTPIQLFVDDVPIYLRSEPRITADQIKAVILEHMTATYACTRVWEAWSVGTMSEADFVPLEETEMPDELAAAIVAKLKG